MRVGFIGIGKMGGPVAELVRRGGHELVVHDADPAAVEAFTARGALSASSPAEVASSCDIVMSALPTPGDVEQVALGPSGVIEGIRPDAIYVDISTSSPELIRKIAARFAEEGAWAVDAPVGASRSGSVMGVHQVMVGCSDELYERLRPVLTTFGEQIIHTGDVGSATVCKLVHQLVGASMSQALAEGFGIAVKAGVDVGVIWDCIRRGLTGRLAQLHEEVPYYVFNGTYEPAIFSLDLLNKDVGLALDVARASGAQAPLGEVAAATLATGVDRGWGSGSAYMTPFRLVESEADVSFALPGVDTASAGRFLSTHPESLTGVEGWLEVDLKPLAAGANPASPPGPGGEASGAAAVVRRFFEIENSGDASALGEVVAPDFKDRYNSAAPALIEDLEQLRGLVAFLHQMGTRVDVEAVTSDGDIAMAWTRSHGHHRVPLFGVEPTGRPFTCPGVEVFRVSEGLIRERWVYLDVLPLLRDLGVVEPQGGDERSER